MSKNLAKSSLLLLFLGLASAPILKAQNIDAIRAEIEALKNSYESRIKNLETKISVIKNQPQQQKTGTKSKATSIRNVKNN